MCSLVFSDDQKCLVAAKGAVEHGIDGKILANLTMLDLLELGVSKESAQYVHQASQELARAQPQESAQPLAGEEHVAGVDYNDESHDVEVGSDMDRSDGGRGMHGSEAADIAFMREVRVVRRNTPRQLKVGRVRPTNRFKPLAEYMPDIRYSMIEQTACCLAIRADLHACSRKVACEPDSHGTTERSFIGFHNIRAIGHYTDFLSREGAL